MTFNTPLGDVNPFLEERSLFPNLPDCTILIIPEPPINKSRNTNITQEMVWEILI